MSRARLLAFMKSFGTVVLAVVIFAFAGGTAKADPCAIACRSQHNACRMAAKLLYSPRCDAQLQACISQCFAAGRFKRGIREGRGPSEFGDHRGPPPEVRGPPEMHGPADEGPPSPRGLRDFRDPRGPRWLGGPGRWGSFR